MADGCDRTELCEMTNVEMVSREAAAEARHLLRDKIKVEALREAINAAHHEQRQALAAGREGETLTLFQHWSATAGWLAHRVRQVERLGEADWPDAMNSAEPVDPADSPIPTPTAPGTAPGRDEEQQHG